MIAEVAGLRWNYESQEVKDYLRNYLYAEVIEKDMDPIPSSVVDLNLCHTS